MTSPDFDEHDMDDGATEVVSSQPMRSGRAPVDGAKVAKAGAGGRMASMQASGHAHRTEFILIRRQGQDVVRLSLPHGIIFKLVWQLWEAKRVQGEEDPGIAVAEVSELLTASGSPMATSSISAALRSMIKNGALKSTDQYVGWQARRTRYYPTTAGVEAFALAEVLGYGALVQVGKSSKAWKNRSNGEPSNLFQHAALLRPIPAAPISTAEIA